MKNICTLYICRMSDAVLALNVYKDGRHDSSPKLKPNHLDHPLVAGCSVGRKSYMYKTKKLVLWLVAQVNWLNRFCFHTELKHVGLKGLRLSPLCYQRCVCHRIKLQWLTAGPAALFLRLLKYCVWVLWCRKELTENIQKNWWNTDERIKMGAS